MFIECYDNSSGAAGGLPFSLMNFYSTEVISGIKYIAELSELESKIEQANIVITGEGKVDNQSFYGKTISHVIELCRKHQKPYVILCGISASDYSDDLCRGSVELKTFNRYEYESMLNAAEVLRRVLADVDFMEISKIMTE